MYSIDVIMEFQYSPGIWKPLHAHEFIEQRMNTLTTGNYLALALFHILYESLTFSGQDGISSQMGKMKTPFSVKEL